MQAWLYFVHYSFERQMRARILVVISLALFALVAFLVHLNTRFERWSMKHWRVTVQVPSKAPGNSSPDKPKTTGERFPLGDVVSALQMREQLPSDPSTSAVEFAVISSVWAAIHDAAGPRAFTGAIVVSLFASFLLPLWTLTFAAESIGRPRESRTLTWLLLRPLPRWSIYLGAFLAALPGALVLNVGGFVLFCLLGGAAGRFTLPLYWFPILLGTLAFAALFQLLSALFQRSGILGLLYAFFLELIAGNLPGQQKLLSISYYVRCAMLDAANKSGLQLDLAGTRPAVAGSTATATLIVATFVLLAMGMWVFSRKQYVEPAAA